MIEDLTNGLGNFNDISARIGRRVIKKAKKLRETEPEANTNSETKQKRKKIFAEMMDSILRIDKMIRENRKQINQLGIDVNSKEDSEQFIDLINANGLVSELEKYKEACETVYNNLGILQKKIPQNRDIKKTQEEIKSELEKDMNVLETIYISSNELEVIARVLAANKDEFRRFKNTIRDELENEVAA